MESCSKILFGEKKGNVSWWTGSAMGAGSPEFDEQEKVHIFPNDELAKTRVELKNDVSE